MKSRVIRLKPWEENGAEHIAIDFRFNAEIIATLKDIGAELSPTSGYWLMPATVGNIAFIYGHLQHFGALFNCGVKPFDKDQALLNQEKPKALSFKEICATLKACRNIKQRCLLTLMYSSGLRAGEAAGLRLNDLNYSRGSLSIRAARGREAREAILAQTSIPIIETYLKSYRPREWLFDGAVNGHLSTRGIKLILKQALIRAGIHKKCGGLTLRNSLITHMLLQNIDPFIIENLLNGSMLSPAAKFEYPGNQSVPELSNSRAS